MIGDKLVIEQHHTERAVEICALLKDRLRDRFVVTVAGESGSGKSELASEIARLLTQEGLQTGILQQDDYFVYPPQTNAKVRKKDIGWVGTGEVKLDLLDRNLSDILGGKQNIEKPLAIFEEDRFITEKIAVGDARVAIAEGTYTTLLNNAHCHIFIDRTFRETKAARLERAREEQDDFLERVLTIEHDIISGHKAKAHIIVGADYSVGKAGQ